jgi:hypothetical protein
MRFAKSVLRFTLQYIAPALVTLAILIAGDTWPQYKAWFWIGFWVLFVVGFGIYIYRVMDEPVNYKSIGITAAHIEYKVSIDHHIIAFQDIVNVEYVREQALFDDLYGPYLETKWMVKTADGKFVEIMDEWPDRRKMLRGFKNYLPGFDAGAAIQGIRSKKEGRWPCYARS